MRNTYTNLNRNTLFYGVINHSKHQKIMRNSSVKKNETFKDFHSI